MIARQAHKLACDLALRIVQVTDNRPGCRRSKWPALKAEGRERARFEM
jgi:hypothetical protein